MGLATTVVDTKAQARTGAIYANSFHRDFAVDAAIRLHSRSAIATRSAYQRHASNFLSTLSADRSMQVSSRCAASRRRSVDMIRAAGVRLVRKVCATSTHRHTSCTADRIAHARSSERRSACRHEREGSHMECCTWRPEASLACDARPAGAQLRRDAFTSITTRSTDLPASVHVRRGRRDIRMRDPAARTWL